MFFGQYRHAIDAKGRLSVPKKYLEPFRDSDRVRKFFGTRGLDRCVFLFLGEQWDRVVAQVRRAALGSEKARGFGREFFSMARDLPVDASGRILLPKEYRQLAGIDSEVVLVGVDQRIEIWSPAAWDEEMARNSESYEESAVDILGGWPDLPLGLDGT
jgi:MraZ protein